MGVGGRVGSVGVFVEPVGMVVDRERSDVGAVGAAVDDDAAVAAVVPVAAAVGTHYYNTWHDR